MPLASPSEPGPNALETWIERRFSPATFNGFSKYCVKKISSFRGMQHPSQNSLQHGLFAKVIVPPGESQEEFDALQQGFLNE